MLNVYKMKYLQNIIIGKKMEEIYYYKIYL